MTKGIATVHFKLPDGPREPYNELSLSFLANQLAIPAARTTLAYYGGNFGTASLVSYEGEACSEREIVQQQGVRTATAYTIFSALTLTLDWKSEHYVTDGVNGEFIDWSHSLGGPSGGAVTMPTYFPWQTYFDAPLGSQTTNNWPIIWQSVNRICTFPFDAVLKRSASETIEILPGAQRTEAAHAFEDIARFLVGRLGPLRQWVARSHAERRFPPC